MNEKRKRIDEIDERLLKLLSERLDAAKEIGEYKKSQGLEIHDPQREEERLSRVKAFASEKKAMYLEEIFKKIIEECREYEK